MFFLSFSILYLDFTKKFKISQILTFNFDINTLNKGEIWVQCPIDQSLEIYLPQFKTNNLCILNFWMEKDLWEPFINYFFLWFSLTFSSLFLICGSWICGFFLLRPKICHSYERSAVNYFTLAALGSADKFLNEQQILGLI